MTNRITKVGARFLGAGVLALGSLLGTAAAAASDAAQASQPARHEPILQIAAARGGSASKPPVRGSSAELYGGTSADRYGGSSADRGGVAGPRDRRITGDPKRTKGENATRRIDDQDQDKERDQEE